MKINSPKIQTMSEQEEKIIQFLSNNIGKNEKLALLLDYDGTLAPISPHPNLAKLPAETRIILEKLAKCENIFCAIISGRQADNAKQMMSIENFTYAGSHGFEIIYTDGSRYKHTVPVEELNKMKNVEEDLKKISRDGAWVENKGKVLTFHYRDTPDDLRLALIEQAQNIIRNHGLNPTDAICAVEVQPPIKWNKGYAGEYLLKNKFGEDWNNKVKAIFIGDDISDEKLMELCKGKITTFRVASSKSVKTASDFQLFNLQEVITVLQWIESQYC